MIYRTYLCKKNKHMKWIPKLVTSAIILALFAFKMITPHQSLLSEIGSDIIIVLFLLGVGEHLIMHGFILLNRSMRYSKTSSAQQLIMNDTGSLRKLILMLNPFERIVIKG